MKIYYIFSFTCRACSYVPPINQHLFENGNLFYTKHWSPMTAPQLIFLQQHQIYLHHKERIAECLEVLSLYGELPEELKSEAPMQVEGVRTQLVESLQFVSRFKSYFQSAPQVLPLDVAMQSVRLQQAKVTLSAGEHNPQIHYVYRAVKPSAG